MCRNHRYRVRVVLRRDGRTKETVSRLVLAETRHAARIDGEEWGRMLLDECSDLLGTWSARVSVTTL
jgi:hypothetical protein